MTLALWMVLAFACWTLLVLLGGIGVRRWLLIFTGKAALTSFPGDVAHGSVAYRRAVRAHANCFENLPVFAAIVLVASTAHLNPPPLGALSVATMTARVFQTSVHMLLPETTATVALRFTLFLVQVLAMITMVVLIARAAL
jgi:uncharacterized MAPEG superfamily protein